MKTKIAAAIDGQSEPATARTASVSSSAPTVRSSTTFSGAGSAPVLSSKASSCADFFGEVLGDVRRRCR